MRRRPRFTLTRCAPSPEASPRGPEPTTSAPRLIQPINLSKVPYVTGTKTRVLKPNFEEKSWEVVGDYKTPKAFKGDGQKKARVEDEQEEGK